MNPKLKAQPTTAVRGIRSIAALMIFVGFVTAICVFVWWNAFSTSAHKFGSTNRKYVPLDQQPEAISLPRLPEEDFIGSQACAECHSQVSERYQRSAMAHALSTVTDFRQPVEDYERRNSFDRGSCNYRVENRDGHVWHHESMSDDEGLIYDQSEEIQYAMGSNTRGRSYMLWRNEALYISPIAWYSKDGWDLSPNYPPDHHPRFSRRVTDSCINCHCGRVVKEKERDVLFPQPVFHEISIGCERCHGPAKRHVEFHKERLKVGTDPLLNLATLTSAERDAVCYQCHFMGEERILRYGRSEGDFRPGMKLGEIWTVFVRGNGTDGDAVAAVSQAMQMQSSRCYQASGKRLGCVSCHDPHETPRPEQRPALYDQRCLNCHQERGCSLPEETRDASPASGSCTHCHMPPLRAKDIPHTSQTDHRIPRYPDSRTRSNPLETMITYDEEGLTLPRTERYRAEGLMKSRLAEKRRSRELAQESVTILRRVQPAIPDDEPIANRLVAMLVMLGKNEEAESNARKLIERFPQHESALLHLANGAHDARRFDEADQFYARLIAVNPTVAVTRGRWAHVLGQLDRFDDAITQAEIAMKLDPTMLPLYGWLAEAYAIRGDLTKSQETRHTAERLSRKLKSKNVR